MKRFVVQILLLFVISWFSKCASPPTGTSFKTVTVTVTNFIGDCKAGNETAGVTTEDVNYVATIKVKYPSGSGSNYNMVTTYTVNSPSGPIKNTFSKQVEVPTNKGVIIEVEVDASECSRCTQGTNQCPLGWEFVNGIPTYKVDRPFWKYSYSRYGGDIPANLTFNNTLMRIPRSPLNCNCNIKA